MRKRLHDDEAQYLGFNIRKHDKGRNTARYTVTQEQFSKILEIRNTGIYDSCRKLEVNPQDVKHLWKKTKKESIFIKNPLFVSPRVNGEVLPGGV